MSTEVEILDDKVVLTRSFAASRERVWKAWTDPAQTQRWWGCAMTRSVESAIEVRVGGQYSHTMELEGMGSMKVVGTFTEVSPLERLQYTFETGMPIPDVPPCTSTVTVEFEESGDGGTTLRLTHEGFPMPDFRGHVREGWGAAFEKLDGTLAG